jgi:hypothetical protein
MIVSFLLIQQMYILIIWSVHAVPSVSWLLGDPPQAENKEHKSGDQPSAKGVTEQSRGEGEY